MPNSNQFNISGPTHLLSRVDWTDRDDRRAVIASLVEGAYSLAHDNMGNRHARPQAHVEPWWNYFHFKLVDVVRDVDDSIITVIYKNEYPDENKDPDAPTYVIAFRGIMIKRPTIQHDIKSCIAYTLNNIQGVNRFHHAMAAVQKMVNTAGSENVWLAGHSLGAAIALVVGKKMVLEKGVLLETYLFNPPFIGLPIELIGRQKVKHAVRIGLSFIKASLARAIQRHDHDQHSESLAKLSKWSPHLFVNKDDPICAEYIGYFQNKEKMKKLGAEKIENIAGMVSVTSLLTSRTGGDSQALHLIPSADLTINNSSTASEWELVHGIRQWWDPDFRHSEAEASSRKKQLIRMIIKLIM